MENVVTHKITTFFADYPLQTYSKGQIIIQAGIAPAGIFYLTDGRIDEYDIAPTGNQVVINSFKPGAFFPMSWAINHTPNDYFFTAATESTARLAPQQDVMTFLQANPDVTFDLLARVYRGTDGLLRRLAHLMGGSARSRLLFELINAADRFGTTASTHVTLQLSESDLAQRSGLARETVSRTLGELKQQGLIAVVDRKIVIPNLEQLKTILGDTL